jgi:hypothetical protein
MLGSAGWKLARFGQVALTVTAIGLVSCGGDDGDNGGTTAAPAAETTSTKDPKAGGPILIKTRVNIPTGTVLDGSSIGGSPFCPGGTFRDKHGTENPSVPPYGLVDRTFRCRDGSLRIGFTPGTPQGRTQRGPWKTVSGTGAYEGMRGGGDLKATFEPGSNKKGRETFTGKVDR